MNNKKHFKRIKPTPIFYEDVDAGNKISLQIQSLLPVVGNQPVVVVCIGTDRSTGDSLGPLIGSTLKEINYLPFHVYGTLEQPVHAVNLEKILTEIQTNHVNPYIISIDACLGRHKNIGMIQVGKGPLKPGAGVNKELPSVGDMHITGIVNVSGFMEFFVLQNTRLNLVFHMAKTIASGIHLASLSHNRRNYWGEMKQDHSFEEEIQ